MSDYEEVEDALRLVKDLCTTEQIQALLRKRKGIEHVRISAETKDVLVDRNLKEAIEANAIQVGEVFDLIRYAEENGNQHIFYYKPKTKGIADTLTYEAIAQRLWGTKWEEAVSGFPSVRLKPSDYKYSDFRSNPKKPKDWILKVYGDTLITRFTGKTEQRGPNVIWREYVQEPLRVVLVARWNSPDLLEVRVQRNESRRTVEGWRTKLWEMLSPALAPAQFEEWELAKPMARLVLEQQPNNAIYTCRDASIVDTAGVHVTFETYADQGDLFASIQARKSLQDFITAKSDCKGLTVTWLPGANGTPEKETRTLLAAKEPHEMIALAHCSSEDLDYVTNQLRRFSKKAS